MKTFLVLNIVVSALIISFTSCKKYEDGPKVSFQTKTSRVAGEWVIDKAFINEVEDTSIYDYAKKMLMTLENDGTGKQTYLGKSTIMEWAFTSKKENIKIRTKNTDGTWNEWLEQRILRLVEDELWLEYSINIFGMDYLIETRYSKA